MAESGEGKKNSTKYGGGNSQTQDDGTSGHVPDRSHLSDDYTEKKTNKMPKQNTSSDTTAGTRVNSQKPPGKYVSQAMGMLGQNKESQESREERLHGKNTTSKVATKADPSSGQICLEKFDNKKGEDRTKVTASKSAKGNGLTGVEHQTSAKTSSDNSNLVMEDEGSFVLVSEEISINVQLQCGKKIIMKVDPKDSIYSVKNKLDDPEGICLMFQDKELDEDKPLIYYALKNGATLHALNRQESDKSSTADDLKNTQNQPMTSGETTGGNDRKGMENPEITTGDSTVGSGLKGMENPAMTAGDSTGGNGSKVTQYPAMTAGESSGGNDTKGMQNPAMTTGDSTGGNGLKGMVNPAKTTVDTTGGNGLEGMENHPAKTTVDTTGGSGSKGMENPAKTTVDTTGGNGLKGMENQPANTTVDTTGGNGLKGMENHPAKTTVDTTGGNGLEGIENHPAKTTVDTKGGNGLKGMENQPANTGDSAEGSDLTQRQEPGMVASNADKGNESTEIHKRTMTACDPPTGLQVIVVSLDKKKIAIDVKPDETVAAVKEKLMDKIACETEDFCLNLDGERLDDKHTVKSYKIYPNSKIMMMRQRRKGGNKEKMPSLSSTDEHGTGATDEHGTGTTDEHGTGATDEHGTGADQADDSDEVVYDNKFDESTGNPLEFTKGLVSVKKCNEGSILKLKCTVNKQDMKAMWYKDEKRLEQNERITQISKDLTHILEIQNVSQSDAGEYRVKIENLELTSKVTVKGIPLAFQQELVMEDSLKEGLNLHLRCSMNKLHTKPTWYKDGKPLEKDKRITQTSEGLSHILEIQNVCLQDSGVYTVKIENLCSTSKVTILEKPLAVTLPLQKTKKVEEGKDVQMKCIVSKPNLKAKWTLNGKVIKNMETRIIVESSEMLHQLTIKNVTMDDAGEYCLEIEDLQEKTILEVCVIDNKENEDIEGARGNSLPIFDTSGTPDENEPGDFVSVKSIHTNHPNKSIGKTGHSLTQKGTHRSSKTVSSGNEVENFDDSTGICQKSRLADVPSSEDMLTPQKEHVLHNAPGQTLDPCSSKMLKEKPMVNPCGKDLGDSSQRDGKSNPHSSIEDPVNELAASLDSLKISDSDAETRQSLPPTDDQQITGQRGASGQADSKPLLVIFEFSGDEQKRVPLNFEKYMKYHYVLNHERHFTNVANDLKKEKQIEISVKGGILHFDQGLERRCIKTVIDFIFTETENIVVTGWPYSGVDIEKAEQEILSSELGKLKEIYVRRYKDEMHVAYDFSLSTEVDNYVSNMLKKFSYINKENISEKSEVPYILRKILEKDDWKVQFKDKYPNVKVEWEPDDDEDVVKVVFTGNKEKVLEAMKWFEENIVGEYCSCSEEMKKIPEVDLFSQLEEVVLEYLHVKYENQKDIVYAINEKKNRVWFCSKTSQGNADIAKKEITNKGEIVKTVEIPVDKTMLHDTGINELIPDWNKSKYAVVQVIDHKIVVKGLEKYVREFEGKIKEMLERKQNMPKAGNFLEYDSFLLFIEENDVLKNLSERYQIQYESFGNEVKTGIFFTGEEASFAKFNEELERKRKEYVTHNIDIHLGKGMESTKLDEILHTTEKDHDGHVKIEKMKNKDTKPGNHQTATVLGPTLKDDLQDCLYTQWCLDTYTVTVVETRSDFQSADVVLVPVDDRSKSDYSQGSVKEITVPIPESKMYTKNPIYIIETTISNTLSDEACVSVHIKSSAINGWSRYRYVKPILYSLVQWVKKSKGPRKDIVLCCCDKDAFYCCSEYCQDAFKTKYETVKPINKDLYMDDFVVEVRKGGIVDFAADVIVNTTSCDLKLDFGAVSRTILKSAGPELQNDVHKKRPKGIKYGEILETEAFKLENAKVILHGALEAYDKTGKSLQKLEEFVSSCFSHADSKQYTSIALPAIGTGNLGYNKNEVAATMFKAAKKFFRDHHPSALRRVLFVVYGQDIECLKAFEKEEKLWNQQYLVSQSRAVVYEGVRVQPYHGSLLDTTTDAVIYFWDDGKIHGKKMGSSTMRGNILFAVCGPNIFYDVSNKMINKKENMIQVKPECIKAEMFVIRCQNEIAKIYDATKECLQKADKCKDTTSISIAFDRTHSFLLNMNKELPHFLCEAIKDISHELHQIKQVEIMVEDEKSFQKVLEYFNMAKAGLLKIKEPLRIEVSGFKEHVTKAVAEIKEKFSQLQTGNDISEAEHGNDKKDTKIKGTKYKTYIEPSTKFAKYVEVHNIPEGLDKEGLKKILFKEGEFPIALPKVVYYVGSSEALFICQSEQDAIDLSKCSNQEPFKFSSVKGKALSSVTKTIDQNTVEKMKEDGMYNQFKQDLHHADIQIKGESPFVLVAPTTFQYSYVKFILEELTGETVTSEHDDFHNIEAIKDVQENVWDILCCSDQFREIKDTCKDISYDKDTYTVMIGIELSKDDFQKITAIVDDLRDKEWDEIPLEKEHCNKSKADRWCDEVKEVTGYECCKYIDGKGKVLVYAVNYDDILKIKHLIGVKTGKIKTTGKARRGGKATSDNDRRQVDTAGSFGAESKSPDRRIKGKNFQKYITKENIHVFVYEANILQLDVDCIVNAANESLQHGGGVAAVIEKAAGYQLTKESNDFVRKNRNLPVGTACTTTAGNLSYNCVIHTVGPRWSAYSPHLLQDVQECQRHLYQAVYNSFLEAEKTGLKSIALPAISSAIFGVPEEICVQQYALATFDYSKRTSDEPTALKEIHFIDKNSNIVKKIQDAFYLVFVEGEMPHCDSSKFVKSRRHRRGHSPGSYTGAQASFSSSKHKDSFNASTQSATSDVFEVTQIEPLSFFDEKSNAYAYLLHGKEEYKLLLSRGDMLQVKASGVVIPVDNRGKRGNIGERLFAMIPKEYEKAYTSKVSANFPHKKFCDTFVTAGYNCGYGFILHAVFSKSNQRKQDVHMLYNNILSSCDKENGIHSIVTTLLGSDTRSESDIKACADMFLQSYLEYYSRPVTKKSLLVHLVCREDLVYDCVKSVFDEYVMSKKPELNKTQEDKDTSASVQQVEKPENDHEEENCVICMDTITDPETLKCGHTFCKDCIQAQFSFKQACPTCGLVCGVITGDQPEGDMRCTVERYTDCCGYEGYGRIVITYSFFGGRQGPEHPSPGTIYKGITRVAYLPNNDEGRKILAMLKIAFERKLVFTIGSSRTTGQEGVITWNDIHHKTNPRSHQQFGYPDPGYLERVKDELVVKGVTEKDIPKQ